MSKIVKTVLVVAAVAAVVIFAPQIATFLGTVGLSTVAAAAVTSAIVGTAISIGLTAVAGLLIKQPRISQSLVDRLNTSVNPTAPRKIIFGRTAAGADVRFLEEHDLVATKKDGYTQVVALASHRINAVLSWTLEDDLSWNGSSVVGKYAGGIQSFAPILEGSAANASPKGSGTYWTSSARFTGCAYYSARFVLNPDVFPSGIPQRTTTIVEGCPVYDPRRDSTVPGGSGTHRITDQTTWAYRVSGIEIGRNPALALLTYLTGWRINGRLVWGMGVPVARIDVANFILYANLCEEQVQLLGGGTVQRYTCDGILSTADTHEASISAIAASMGASKLVDTGGLYQLVGGHDDTASPKVAFSADDLIGPYEWRPAAPTRDRYNIARGRFADPANLYQLNDWGAVETDPFADQIDRTMVLDLGMVSRSETCQRIAKQFLLKEALTPGTFTATFGPRAFAVQVGSLLTLSLPAEGWNSKLFRVTDQAEAADLIFSMTLREESAAVYAWDREEKPLPPSIRPPGYDPAATITPVGLAATARTIAGAGGNDAAWITVTWTPDASGKISGIEIQTREQGGSTWTVGAELFDATAGSFVSQAAAPGAIMDVRARYRMVTGVYSPFVSTTVTSAAIDLPTGSNGESAEIEYSINGTSGWHATPAANDVYMRVRVGASSAWSPAYKIVGQDGLPGATGNKVVFAWRRSATVPTTPSGNNIPSGWASAPPAGTDPLYLSTATQSATGVTSGSWSVPIRADAPSLLVQWSVDGSTGWHASYQAGDLYSRQSTDGGATYSAAIRVVGEDGAPGPDGSFKSVVFRRAASQPSTPTTGSGTIPSGWSDGPPAGADPLWQTVATFRAATQLSSWSTPVKISGDNGATGPVGPTGGPGANGASAFTLIGRNGVVVTSPNSLGRASGADWNADAYAAEPFANGIRVSAQATDGTFIGINTDPATPNNAPNAYATIDHAWHRSAGYWYIYESGVYIGQYEASNPSHVVSVTYDNRDVVYAINGSERKRTTIGAGRIFYADFAIYNPGETITQITVASAAAAGANAFTLVGRDQIVPISPSAMRKVGGGLDWDSWGHTAEAYPGGTGISGKAQDANSHCGIGLSDNPFFEAGDGNDYFGVRHWWHYTAAIVGGDNKWHLYREGTVLLGNASFGNANSTVQVVNDGAKVEYICDAELIHTSFDNVQPTTPLYGVIGAYNPGAGVRDITFAKVGTAGSPGTPGVPGTPGPPGPAGITSAPPVPFYVGTTDFGSQIFLAAGAIATAEMGGSIYSDTTTGSASFQIQVGVGGGWTVIASGTVGYYAPFEPGYGSASGSFTNTTGSDGFFSFRAVVNAPGGYTMGNSYLRVV